MAALLVAFSRDNCFSFQIEVNVDRFRIIFECSGRHILIAPMLPPLVFLLELIIWLRCSNLSNKNYLHNLGKIRNVLYENGEMHAGRFGKELGLVWLLVTRRKFLT